MPKSLFITYDGLTDPLGQSQILPYLTGLSRKGHEISILSCEKTSRYKKNRGLIRQICNTSNIKWIPLIFHTRPPILSKYYDLYKLKVTATQLHRQEKYDIIHCRSYLSALIGMELKKSTGVKYLFDMRGFWVDERVDGGLWDTKKLFYRLAYKSWKKKEALLIKNADHIISLTKAGKNEIEGWPSYARNPITVIPCSADMQLFYLTDANQKNKARQKLNIDDKTLVMGYLGSLGTWYLLDKMLLLFKAIREIELNVKFLFLTPDDPQKVLEKAEEIGLEVSDFIIQFAQRNEVPQLMKACDIAVSFIKPAYSKIASSPTKLGELLAMGIPVICNDIGDVARIIELTHGGLILKDFNSDSMNEAVSYIKLLGVEGANVDQRAVEEYYSLEGAIDHYDKVYNTIILNR